MPTPSLLIVPARFKSGKLYSQIPVPVAPSTSSVGDFTITRATAATRVNASGFIESVASGIPRLDYFASGGTVGCPALLVEPSGSNLALQSENFGTTWNPQNLLAFGSGSVLNTTATIDPYGTNVADLIVANTTSGVQHRIDQTTASASGSYTFSAFLKPAGYNFGRLRIGTIGAIFNLSNGTIASTEAGITSSIQNYGNGWYRCIVSKAASSASEIIRINMQPDAVTADFAGDGTSGIYVFGAQYETGSIATSYIPTTTGSITRNADVVSVSGAVSGSIGQQSGTVYIECQSEFATNDIIVINTAGQSPGNNYVSITKTATNVFRLSLVASGTTILIDQTSAITSFAKIAVAYASGNTALFINGTQIGSTNTTGFSFNAALNNITFISNMVSGTKTTRIRAVALYTTRLTNAELAALTA